MYINFPKLSIFVAVLLVDSSILSSYHFLLGHCITLASRRDVCGLNSYAVGCDITLSATECRCYDSTQLGNCNGKMHANWLEK